jgi:hypothetical protein
MADFNDRLKVAGAVLMAMAEDIHSDTFCRALARVAYTALML